MTFLDIWEQPVITEFIRRRHEDIRKAAGGEEEFGKNIADTILPTVPHNGRYAKIRVQDVVPTGMAPFKAPGASPMLWTRKPQLREEVIELVDIDEFHRVDPIDMLQLQSPDPRAQAETAWTIADRGADMQDRNELRTLWMKWEALKGTLVVNYPNAASQTIDYGIPVGHFTTFGTPWTDTANADIVEQLWALGSIGLSDAGVYLPKYHFNSATWRYMRRNELIRDQLSSYGRNVFLPTENDLRDLLREGTQFVIVDDGYLPEGATDFNLTKWIGDGKILATTADYKYAGRRIGEMLDGWVLVGPPGSAANLPVAKQGMQSEWIYERKEQQTLLRQVSARIPRIVAPNAIAWATAY